MQSSLTLKTNLMVIIGSASIAFVLAIVAHPFPWLLLLEGVVAGAIAGVLNRMSMAKAGDAYRSATSAAELRAAVMSTLPGKLGVYLQWALIVVLLATATLTGVTLGAIAGYAAFVCVRDLVALQAVLALGRSAS